MQPLTRFTKRASLALAVAASTAVVAVVVGRAAGSAGNTAAVSTSPDVSPSPHAPPVLAPHFPLSTVDARQIAGNGISLSSPASSAAPTITAAEAEARVLRERPDAQFREIGLAWLQQTNSNAPFACLCWIVSVVPRAESFDHINSARAYDIYVFDATSGDFVTEVGGDPPH